MEERYTTLNRKLAQRFFDHRNIAFHSFHSAVCVCVILFFSHVILTHGFLPLPRPGIQGSAPLDWERKCTRKPKASSTIFYFFSSSTISLMTSQQALNPFASPIPCSSIPLTSKCTHFFFSGTKFFKYSAAVMAPPSPPSLVTFVRSLGEG